MNLYMKEREGKTHCRLPKPEPNAEYQCRVILITLGAGEADGGKRGSWGQARPMGAVGHRATSLVNTPPLAPGFPDEVKQNQRKKRKSEILLQVPNPIKSKENSANPNTQSETKETQVLPVLLSESNLLPKFAKFNSPESLS